MRVLHLYQHFAPERGGVADVLLDLAGALNAAGGDEHVVLTVAAGRRTVVERVGGVPVIRTPARGWYYTPLCPDWPGWIRRLRPDVVHVHLPCPMAELAALAAGHPRVVVSLHNDYVRPRALVAGWGPLHRVALRRARRVVASSRSYADSSPALRRAGLAARAACIPYGVRGRDLYTPGPRRTVQAEGRRRVVFLGRLCYYKGLGVLLAAARAPGLGPERVVFEVIGEGPLGPWLRRAAADLPHVRFLGPLDEAAAIQRLRAADVFVLPSTHRSEAFGLAQLKAMACGAPVVSSDLPGVAWVNRAGETGLTVPPGDAGALARAITGLLEDEALRGRLAAGARERAAALSVERMVGEHAALYAAVAAEG